MKPICAMVKAMPTAGSSVHQLSPSSTTTATSTVSVVTVAAILMA